MTHPHALLAATLDAGDRLVAALSSDDVDAASLAVAERDGFLSALLVAGRPATMPQALVVRYHAQDAALRRALAARLAAAEAAAATVGRARAAHDGYGAPWQPARLDTAPR